MLWHGKNFRGILTKAKEMIFDNTGTDLISTNAEDAIKEVNSNLTWKMETINGNNTFTIPEDAKECIAIMRYGNPGQGLQSLSWSINFPNPREFPTSLTLTNGHYQGASLSTAMVQISVNPNGNVQPIYLAVGGVDYISTSVTYLYYR